MSGTSPFIPIILIYAYAILGFLVGVNGLQYLPPEMKITPSLRVLFSYLIALGWPIFALYVILFAKPEENTPSPSSPEAPQNRPQPPKASMETAPIMSASAPPRRPTRAFSQGIRQPMPRKKLPKNGKARTRQPKHTATKAPVG